MTDLSRHDMPVATAAPDLPRRAGLTLRALRYYRSELAIAAAILLIDAVVSLWSPQVFTGGNTANVAQAAAPLVVMALARKIRPGLVSVA